MLLILTLFVIPLPAQAAPALKIGHTYEVKKATGTARAAKLMDNYDTETRMLYESFAGEDRRAPTMSNETTKKIRVTKLPAKGDETRREMLFQSLVSVSKVQLPGAFKPFENRQDLGAYLFDKPLLLVKKGSEPSRIENLAAVRARVERSVNDPVARQGLRTLLGDDAMKGQATEGAEVHVCAEGLAGQAAGAKWAVSREMDGAKLEFRCEFLGFGEANGKEIELVRFTMPKVKNTRTQPNGAQGVVETSGEGTLALDPASGEAALTMVTDVSAEPTTQEIEQWKKKGKPAPRGSGVLKVSSHSAPRS